MPLLRQVAYALGPDTLRRAMVAFTSEGAFVRHPNGIEGIPVGEFYVDLCLPAEEVRALLSGRCAISPRLRFKRCKSLPNSGSFFCCS